jgi:hypothetical protein
MVKILNYAKNITRSSNDNLLINGNFDIWQRGTPFYAGGFTADRWYMISNGSNKASRIAGNVGLDNATNIIRLQTLSSGSYPVLSQAIDSDISAGLRGKTTTFSFYAKKPADSNWTGLVYGRVYYSTDFNSLANGKIEISDAAFSGSLATDAWTLYSNSFIVPDNASTLMVEISPSGALSNSSIIDIGRAKLEIGSVVTNFKPLIYNEELNKCKRFYQKVETTLKAGTGAGNSAKKFGVSTPLPVLPRSNNAKITVAKNNNSLIENFTATISNDAYLNVIANAKNLYSELSIEFFIDDEIPYGKEPGKIDFASIIRGSGKIDMDWNPPTNSDSTISYTALYGTSPNEIVNTQPFTDSSGSITGLSDSSSYYIKLYSSNSYGQSVESNIFEVAPLYNVPSGVSSLSGVWGFDETYVSWNAPSNNGGSTITGYRIDRSMYANFPDVDTSPNYNSTFYVGVPTTTSPTTNSQGLSLYYKNNKIEFKIAKFSSELTSTGNYYFRIIPINLAGTGTHSSFTLAKTVPSAPINLSTSVGDGSITISYLPSTGNGGNVISFFGLERSTNSAFSSVTSSSHTANYTPITVTGLTNNTTYYFRMRGYNQLGYGPYSSGVLAVPNKPLTIPNAPSGFIANWIDDDTINLGWNPPADNGGSPIINYTIYVSSGSGFTSNLLTLTTQNNISSISFDVPITGNYSTFYFRGKANNSVGSSANSSSTFLSKQVPDSPLLYNLNPGNTTVLASWYKPVSKGSAITGYNLQYSTSSTFATNVNNTTVTGLQTSISSLTNNTNYYFRVRALNTIGTGSFSNIGQATPVPPYSAPSPPLNSTLSFTAVPQNGSFNMTINNAINMTNYSQLDTIYGVRVTTPYSGGPIWGRNPYTHDSDIRTAAIQAGALTSSQTGIVYVYLMNGLTYYSGISKNGITSSSWGSWNTSYYIIGSNITCTGFTYGNTVVGSHIPVFKWQTPSNNGGLAITGYEVQYAADSNFSTQLTTYSIPGNVNLNAQCVNHNSVSFCARVRAYNPSGVSSWLNHECISKGLSSPSSPTNFTATASSATGINLTWVAPSGPAASGYDIPGNISYYLQYWNITTPSNKTSTYYTATSATLTVPGPGTYGLSLSTKNTSYFSSNPVVLFVTTTSPSYGPISSWTFTSSAPCCGAKSTTIGNLFYPNINDLKDNVNAAGSTFSSCAGSTGAAFIIADFGSIRNVKSITVTAHYFYGPTYINHASVEGSTDNVNWTLIEAFNSSSFTSATSSRVINGNWNYRYIRLKSGNIVCIDISEFKFT